METNNKQLRAVIYTRVSSDEQTKGYGLEYQLEECEKVVKRNGHILIDVYSDPGISGTIENRPGLSKLRQDAKSGQFDIIYFWKSDMMARDEILQLTLYREFKENGIEVCSATEPEMNELMKGIYAVFGANELRVIKERMYLGRLRALRGGKWIASVPYGYEMNKETLKIEINKQGAQYVKKLFKWFVEEKLSLTGLTQKAQKNQIPTKFDLLGKKKPRSGPYFWSKGSLGRMLGREYYATGEAWFCKYQNNNKRFDTTKTRPEEEWIKVKVPKLVPKDLFDRAQMQLLKNSEFSSRRAKRMYLFAKKIRCDFCSNRLSASCKPWKHKDRETKFYTNATWVETKCLYCKYYREDTVDKAVWDKIRVLFKEPDKFMDLLDKYRNKNSKMDEIKKERLEIAKTDKTIARKEKALLDYQLEGFFSDKVLNSKKEELKKEQTGLLERGQELDKFILMEKLRTESILSIRELHTKIHDKIDGADYELKRRVYGLLVDKIMVKGSNAEVWLNIPSQLLVPDFVNNLNSNSSEMVYMRRTPYSRRPSPTSS